MKAYTNTKTQTEMFIAALCVIAPNWKQPKHPLTGGWVDKLLSIHTVGYCSTVERNNKRSNVGKSQMLC